MKKTISTLLIVTLIISSTTVGFATTTEAASNVTRDFELVGTDIIVLNGAPSGVTFGPESAISGNCNIQSGIISLIVGSLSVATGLSGLAAYFTNGATVAVSLGLGCIYWQKKVSYGEDSQYYYIKSRVRLYSDSDLEKPITEWKTVYTKKSKANGASIGDELL